MREASENRTTDGEARRAEIMRRLHAAGFLSVADLTQQLGVSDMTIRRDLKRLALTSALRVVHGGASLPHGILRTPDFSSRGGRHAEMKRRVASLAVELVRRDATIAIDAGTTPFEVAAALPEDFHGTVITHSIPVLQHLLHLPRARVIGLGGELLAESQALIGPLAVEAIAGLHAEVVFLGAAAVSARGLFISTNLESHTKQTLMRMADEVVLVVDHTKFSAVAPVRLSTLDGIGTLVTDQPPKPAIASRLERAGVAVIHSDSSARPHVAADGAGRARTRA